MELIVSQVVSFLTLKLSSFMLAVYSLEINKN
jgi:hypothetical protein